MATNPFFNQKFPAEQNLIEDLTVETIRMMGQDMIYVPREMINEDKIFGEAGKYKFKDAFPIEMYIESVNGFEGQEDIMSKFGIQVKDKVTLIVARKRFEKEVSEKRTDIKRPREGDLIYFPLSNGLFEINFTEHENPFYVLGKLYVYKLTCELFTYDHSIMDTGVTEIDDLEDESHRKTVEMILTGITGISAVSFYEGETAGQYNIVQGQTGVVGNTVLAQGTVVNYDASSKRLSITTDDTFITTQTTIIKGMDSNARWYLLGLTASNTLIPKNAVTEENYGDNDITSLKAKKDDIISYCETDPFSEGKF
jgi:hypothetical protein